MIGFKREGVGVKIEVCIPVPTYEDRVYTTTWNAGSEAYADFLTQAFRSELETKLRNIREEAYNRGWRDAKSHNTPKDTWFSGRFLS